MHQKLCINDQLLSSRQNLVNSSDNALPYKLAIALFLTAAVLAIYWQVGGHAFIYYDDEEYILLNARLRLGFTAENIGWFLKHSLSSNWHPLTWFSHLLDVGLFGYDPQGHHYVSVALHLANAILLFLLCNRLTGTLWRSAAVAALFAVHPLNVESVAWVAERKNVLSTMFWLLTLHAYLQYTLHKRKAFYLLALFVFTLGLMAKQMLVSIPCILLLLDYWPLQRLPQTRLPAKDVSFPNSSIGNTVLRPSDSGSPIKHSGMTSTPKLKSLLFEKIPFLLLAIIASAIAVVSQQEALGSLQSTTLGERAANASIAYLQYIRKIFWPNDLAVFYPFPESIHTGMALTATALLILATGIVLKLRTRYPALFVGWFWYLLTLLPVIGLVKIGLQSMADRYTYIPAIGIFVLVVWTVSDMARHLARRRLILGVLSCICIPLLSITAWRQTSYWKDTLTLFTRTLAITERNYVALCAIGRDLEKQGKLDEALQKFDEAIAIAPWYEYAQTHQGIILMNRGKVAAAAFKYNEAILQNPTTVPGHINLGIVLALQGNLEEAARNFRIAIDFAPRSAAANYNLALTLYKLGKYDEAISYYYKALETDPTDYECHLNLAVALEPQGRIREAVEHCREALRLHPDFWPAQEKLAQIIQQQREPRQRDSDTLNSTHSR